MRIPIFRFCSSKPHTKPPAVGVQVNPQQFLHEKPQKLHELEKLHELATDLLLTLCSETFGFGAIAQEIVRVARAAQANMK
jgi:hypothetical protein